MSIHPFDIHFDPERRPTERHGYPFPGPQSPDSSEVMEELFFLTDAQWKEAVDKAYDFIVIGSGPCALAFAKTVLEREKDCKVLILERGSFFLPTHFQNLPLPFSDTVKVSRRAETFPWTLDRRTDGGHDGTVRWCHGSVPFFGGRSTVWSTWCPMPTQEEMNGWHEDVIAAAHKHVDQAEKLLRVQHADQVDKEMFRALEAADTAVRPFMAGQRPLYGALQKTVGDILATKLGELVEPGIYRTCPAPLASADAVYSGVDFLKFSVPGALLELKKKYPKNLDMKLNCVVRKILNQAGNQASDPVVATALDTSCGILPLNSRVPGEAAQLILAMGTLPATTLVQNSFHHLKDKAGQTFSAHFISSIVAKMPREGLIKDDDPSPIHQVGAVYIAGTPGNGNNPNYLQQYHIQMSVVMAQEPEKHAQRLLRYMPDVVATASEAQLKQAGGDIVFVCAVLGELEVEGEEGARSTFRPNPQDTDVNTNSILRVQSKSDTDKTTWDAMDNATFAVLETIAGRSDQLMYWHGSPEEGGWLAVRPDADQRRVPALVHESSTLPIGDLNSDTKALVCHEDYSLKGTGNVYVTGGALWPRGGSWNPTLTMVALACDLGEKLVKKLPEPVDTITAT